MPCALSLHTALLVLLLLVLRLSSASADVRWLSFQGLTAPQAVAVDSAGQLYVSLQSSSQVVTLSPSPYYPQISSVSVASPAVAVNAKGDIFAVDGNDGFVTVLQFNAGSGLVTGNFTTGVDEAAQVLAVAVDGEGNVWSADSRSLVSRFSPDGSLQFTRGSESESPSPTAIALNASGAAYWLDGYNQAIKLLSTSGHELESWSYRGLGLPYPTLEPLGLAVSSAGIAFLSDASSNQIVKLDLTQNSTVALSLSFNATAAGLSSPCGLAWEAPDRLWVADSGNNRVVLLTEDGALVDDVHSLYPAFNSPLSLDLDVSTASIVVLDALPDSSRLVFVSLSEDMGTEEWTVNVTAFCTECGQEAVDESCTECGRVAVDDEGFAYVTTLTEDEPVIGQFDADGGLLRVLYDQEEVDLYSGLCWTSQPISSLLVAAPLFGLERIPLNGSYVEGFPLYADYELESDVVSDSQGNIFLLFSDDGNTLYNVSAGAFIPLYVKLSGALGLALDAADNFVIADTGNDRVLWLSPSGELLQEFTTSRPALSGPRDLVVDNGGNVWVADTGNNRLVVFPLAVYPWGSSSSSSSSSSSAAPAPPTASTASPMPSSPFNATLRWTSATSFVASTNDTADVELGFQSPQNVLFILLAAYSNATNDGLDQALLSAPTVDLSNWDCTVREFQRWAEEQCLTLLYTLQDLEAVSPSAAIGTLNVTFPAMSALGYHRLVLVTPSNTTGLLDWVLVQPFVCTTLLTPAGVCSSPCPTGGFCLGDGRVWPEPGYWSVSEHTAPAGCPIYSICPGALQTEPGSDTPAPVLNADGSRDTQRCELGYAGTYCADCAVNYYHSGLACRYCGSANHAELAGLVIVAIVIVAIVTLILLLSPPNSLHLQISVILALQQAVTIGQTAGAFLPSKQAWLQAVFNSVAIINLNVAMFQPGCLIGDLSLVDIFWASILVVLIAALLFTAAAAIRATAMLFLIRHGRLLWLRAPDAATAPVAATPAAVVAVDSPCPDPAMSPTSTLATDGMLERMQRIAAFSRGTKADVAVAYALGRRVVPSWRSLFRARWQQGMIVLGALAYLRLTTASLQMFNCVSVPVPDPQSAALSSLQSLLAADYSTRCFHGEHVGAFVVALLIFIFFSLGFPLFVGLYIHRLLSTPHLAQRLSQLQVWTAKVKRAASVPSSPSSPSASTTDADGLSLKALVSKSLSLQRSSSQTPDTSVSSPSSVSSGGVDKPSMPAEKEARLLLVEQVVLERLSSSELTPRDAARLQVRYLRSAEEMLLLERQAQCGFLLSEFRSDRQWRVQYFPVALLLLSFVFCCAVAFPSTVALTLLLCGLTFIAQGAFVSFFVPYDAAFANGRAIVGAVLKLLQCLVALGVLHAVNVTSIEPDATAAHSLSAQQQLASMTFRFFQQNFAYVATLCCLLLIPIALYAVGRWHKAQQAESAEHKLRTHLQDETEFSTTRTSSAYTTTATPAPETEQQTGQVELTSVAVARDTDPYAELGSPVSTGASTQPSHDVNATQSEGEGKAPELTSAPALPDQRAVTAAARPVPPPLPPRRVRNSLSTDPYADSSLRP